MAIIKQTEITNSSIKPVSTDTPVPTNTPEATDTPFPTDTPLPTPTQNIGLIGERRELGGIALTVLNVFKVNNMI